MRAGPVDLQGFLERPIDLVAVLLAVHVDEVDDDDAAYVPKAQLRHHLVDGLQVDAKRGVFEGRRTDELPRVDVDGHQGFGLVDDQVAP